MTPLFTAMPRTKDPLEYAIKSASFKRQTEKQLREKLGKRFPESDHEAIIERLKELDYVNDREFCEAWIHHRSLTSPRGKFALKRELRQKGVPTGIIEEVLSSYEEGETLEAVLRKKWELLSNQETQKRREKTLRYMTSRGFRIGEVLDVLNEVAREHSE